MFSQIFSCKILFGEHLKGFKKTNKTTKQKLIVNSVTCDRAKQWLKGSLPRCILYMHMYIIVYVYMLYCIFFFSRVQRTQINLQKRERVFHPLRRLSTIFQIVLQLIDSFRLMRILMQMISVASYCLWTSAPSFQFPCSARGPWLASQPDATESAADI